MGGGWRALQGWQHSRQRCSLSGEPLLPWLLSGSREEGNSNGVRAAKPAAKPSRGSPLPFCLLLLESC